LNSLRFWSRAPAILTVVLLVGAAHAADTRPPPTVKPVPHPDSSMTRRQLMDGGATCWGSVCNLHGALWDCSNIEACVLMKTPPP
jgi:hypothetical protein